MLSTVVLRRSLALTAALLVVACTSGSSTTMSLTATTTTSTTAATSTTSTTVDIVGADLVLTGRVVTMTDAGAVEAVAIDGGLVVDAGDMDSVMSHAGPSTPVIDLGDNVAYPGFVDAHAHWIGDREHYGVDTPEEAIDLALSHGWTSIAELWVNRDRLDELIALDEDGRLAVRVDGYLALNHPGPSGERLGDWYLEHGGGLSPSDHLRVRGVKFTIDSYWGTQVLWEAGELAEAFTTAHEAGWQIAAHTVSTDPHQMVLDAFEAGLGGEPNLLRHRIEHSIQVTDDQLRRIAELGLVVVGHTAGFPTDSYADPEYLEYLGEDTAWLNRYRNFVDAGIRFASASDTPWMYPELQVTPDLGRPQDLIAGAMDGKGTDSTEAPPFIKDQTLTFEQALRSVNIDAAYAIGADDLRGHLTAGTYGDVTILDGDMAGASPDELRRLRVVATIVGGEILFCDRQPLCS
jgi:predicted amidohydrolase YtcJ